MKEAELKEGFLRDDFRDSIKWLIVGAVTWNGNPLDKDKHYLRALGMFTSLVQARALYDFFNKGNSSNHVGVGKNARACDFVAGWREPADRKRLYANYMADYKSANRRVFHLVYGRSTTEGGSMGGVPAELKERVLDFALDLIRITKDFAAQLTGNHELEEYRELVKCALAKALQQGHELAEVYNTQNGVPDPL